MNVGRAVEYHARCQPDLIALSAGPRDLTWAELEEETRRLAAGLQELGVEAGERVGVLAANSLEWCLIAVATLRAGGVIVPMNVQSTADDLGYVADRVGLRALALDSGGAARIGDVEAVRPGTLTVSLDGTAPAKATLADLRSCSTPLVQVECHQSDPALVPFTSGTTGRPKGVTLTHDNVRAMAEAYSRLDDLGSRSVSLYFAPLAFNGGVTNAFLGAVLVGARLILEEFVPRVALERIVRDRVTVMTGVPIVFESIAALPEFADADLSSVSTALTGGAVVHEALLAAWAAKGVRLCQSYGLTETTGPITMVPRDRYRDKADTAGVPGIWDRVRLVATDGTEAAPGEVGEVCIRGPQVMAGYWADPKATAEALRDGWLHTGDLGRFDEDGYLSIVDRKTDVIISGGINIYPAEVEQVVATLPGVRECVAFGVQHDRWGETVAVALCGEVDIDVIYCEARARLADYKVPRYLVVSSEPLPRSAFGKLLRRRAAEGFDPARAHRTPST